MATPFKMKGKSPIMKALIGKQNRLPAELKAKILASPAKATTKEVVVKGGKAGKSRAQRDYAKSLDKKASEAYMKDRSSRTGGTDFATADEKTKAKYRAKASKKSPTKLKKSPTKQKPRGKLSVKSKVIDTAKKVTKKLYDSTTVGKVTNYIKKKKKAKKGASTAGTSAKTILALEKSRKNAAREAATRSGDKAAKSYKKQLGPVSLTLDEKTSLRNKKQTETERYESDHINKKTGESLFKYKKSPAKNYKKGYYGA